MRSAIRVWLQCPVDRRPSPQALGARIADIAASIAPDPGSVHSTPPANTSAIAPGRELHPLDVLIDLLGGADFDHEILDPEGAAKLIVERLNDAGFAIVPANPQDRE
jgi:hypothetical protein